MPSIGLTVHLGCSPGQATCEDSAKKPFATNYLLTNCQRLLWHIRTRGMHRSEAPRDATYLCLYCSSSTVANTCSSSSPVESWAWAVGTRPVQIQMEPSARYAKWRRARFAMGCNDERDLKLQYFQSTMSISWSNFQSTNFNRSCMGSSS